MASINSRIKTIAQSAPAAVVVPGMYQVLSDNSRTHEGGNAFVTSDLETLRRSVMSCLLWEKGFYESGKDVSDRIADLIPLCNPEDVYNVALEARSNMKIRHVPLFIAVEMLKHPEHKKLVRKLVSNIIQRPDEITEILSIYWRHELTPVRAKEGQFTSQRAKSKIPLQLIRGIRTAFAKFDQYQMLKWQEKDKPVTMANAIRLIHPDPRMAVRNSPNIDMTMSDVYKGIMLKTANAPDTWESRLSAGGKDEKKNIFSDMLERNQLASLALISNLRGMIEVGVEIDLIRSALKKMNIERVLPYRFITAARYAPMLKDELQEAMFRCVAGLNKMAGKTVLLVDISGSMSGAMSRKPNGRPSDLTRLDGAAALAILAQSICEHSEIYLFNDSTYKVSKNSIDLVNRVSSRWGNTSRASQNYKEELVGFPLSEAISKSVNGGTDLKQAVDHINSNEVYDRIIIFSDDQSASVPPPPSSLGYVINVATNDKGVGYGKGYAHINGFSEAVLTYIAAYEEHLKTTNQ